MADIRRVNVAWTTGIGGTGLSTFYTLDPVDVTAELGTFFNAIKAFFPTPVTWQIPNSGDMITDNTGILSGGWSGGTAATISASGGAGAYVAGTGAYVRWGTNTVVAGRRVKGRTFLVPMLTSQFDTFGTITDTSVATIQTAASALQGSGKLKVWHRPPEGTTLGFVAQVTSATVPDKVTSLRTRRT